MCDTLVITPQASADGVTLLAKNSDRHPNEAQFLQIVPAAAHPPGSMVHCTYIEIPQVHETHAVLLSRPFWMRPSLWPRLCRQRAPRQASVGR
jgi:secernin